MRFFALLLILSAAAHAQAPEPETKRIFGIVPNYRSAATLQNYKPLTTAEKFKIATQDSFDRGTVILGAAMAGIGQLNNSNPSFGQGAAGCFVRTLAISGKEPEAAVHASVTR